jgi:hypothetical protein
MDLVPPPSQMPLGQEEDTLTGTDGALDFRWTRRNRTLQFAN